VSNSEGRGYNARGRIRYEIGFEKRIDLLSDSSALQASYGVLISAIRRVPTARLSESDSEAT